MRYSAQAYASRLKMTYMTTIVVEGESDKFVVQKLLESLSEGALDWTKINIDCVDVVDDQIFSGLGNRDKIEQLESFTYDLFGDLPVPFFALVDREFRSHPTESCDARIQDDHVVIRRVYWTWGHSIENYFFNQRVFEELLSTLLFGDERRVAHDLLGRSFPNWIRAANVVTEISHKLPSWSLVTGSLNDECFEIDQNHVVFSIERWTRNLSRKKCPKNTLIEVLESAKEMITNYDCNPVISSSRTIHGHAGLKLLNAGIDFILKTQFSENWKARTFLKENQDTRLDRVCNSWSLLAKAEAINHPTTLVSDLNRSLHSQGIHV